MRILIGADVPPDPNSGAAGTVFQMNAALRSLGHEVDEIWKDDLPHRIRHGNLHYLLELPRTYRDEVRKRVARCDYDVIELNQPHAYLAARDHRCCKRSGIFINRSHGHEVRCEEELYHWKTRFGMMSRRLWRKIASRIMRRLLDRQWDAICREADGFIVSSTQDADFLTSRYQVEPRLVGVVTQGLAPVYLDRPLGPYHAERQRRLLYVGQHSFVKAPMIVAQVVQEVLSTRSDVSFTWVCHETYHAALKALFAPSVLERVEFCTWMPQEELISVYDQHGIFLFPSFFEGFGKAPLEAMSRGLVVVASDVGGMRDFIIPNENGRLCAVGESAQFASQVLELLQNRDVCRKLSQAAVRTAAKHTWTRCAVDATKFYTELLEFKARRTAPRRVDARL